mmetsp:Transcript_49567/g.107359  ORF Transcript_49567/g.107359 Transcript_49567/m.107359 type:complete len:200 (+) Transcript_49567:1347-1946(+)
MRKPSSVEPRSAISFTSLPTAHCAKGCLRTMEPSTRRPSQRYLIDRVRCFARWAAAAAAARSIVLSFSKTPSLSMEALSSKFQSFSEPCAPSAANCKWTSSSSSSASSPPLADSPCATSPASPSPCDDRPSFTSAAAPALASCAPSCATCCAACVSGTSASVSAFTVSSASASTIGSLGGSGSGSTSEPCSECESGAAA